MKERVCTLCLGEQQWISLAEMKVRYDELWRNSSDGDHIVQHLEDGLKGLNLQAAEPTDVSELGNDVQYWYFRKIQLSLEHQQKKHQREETMQT